MPDAPLCQAPDPAPRRPTIAVPAGACDTHFHVIGSNEDSPYVPQRSFTPPPAPLSALQHMHRALGIERGVIVQVSVHGTDNRVMLAALGAAEENFRGIAVVDETITDEALADMDAAGVRGLRINILYGGGVGMELLRGLAARVAGLEWHMQLLIDVSAFPDFARDMDGIPVPIVVDHMGHMSTARGVDDPGFQGLLALVREGRAWAKLSGPTRMTVDNRPPWPDVLPFAEALVAANPDRLVWGTDWPHVATPGYMPNDGELLDLLADWVPDEALRHKILVENPAALYGFPPVG
ncbi:MAG: amidohydrolase family protein [Alphaproteobacteria bacterium]|nr:amidohydrolase family protein [Alphaproteobacteria bacterium]